jgi:CrcB protein
MAMKSYFWIAIGAGLGGTLRYWCGEVAITLLGDIVPWGTMFVNILGSFIIGYFSALTTPGGRLIVSPIVRQFVTVGFCGGYTTFSSFSLQTQDFMMRGAWLYAGANVLSIVLSLVAVWAGYIWAAGASPLRMSARSQTNRARPASKLNAPQPDAPQADAPLTPVGSSDGEQR